MKNHGNLYEIWYGLVSAMDFFSGGVGVKCEGFGNSAEGRNLFLEKEKKKKFLSI